MTLESALSQPELSPLQTWTVAAACSIASPGHSVLAEAARHLDPIQLQSARAAARLMAMTNVLYRFKDLLGREEYDKLPARLNMSARRTHGGDPAAFELACIAVSALNGCRSCIRHHEQQARNLGLSPEAILAAVRLAAVLQADLK
jgi:lipoyl-dependent peroxiredoxin subunit D